MIELKNISLRQGQFILSDVHWQIPSGSYSVLMGSSGSGKSTLVEIICGLRKPSHGQIIFNGNDVTHWRPAQRQVGYVPQDRALFPGITVRHQIAFGLVLRKVPDREINIRVNELSDVLHMDHLLDRLPEKLSGGEAQRVALARALAPSPTLICLDEPLSALDHDLHDEMCHLLKKVHAYAGITVLHITHSRYEAQRLSTHTFRISGGMVAPYQLESAS